jgi:hypothetical protein
MNYLGILLGITLLPQERPILIVSSKTGAEPRLRLTSKLLSRLS